ncbi:signal peptidase I [Cellulomonas sp.]|uniref:signal peptidase I n=1 Tax=Cellulomonas sp. TaxID=40001 RepID=UPI0028125240|nr:signal peptidase I [Cellulomonas sp.]
MRILRATGNAVLWLVAALGVTSVLVWGATQAGWIQPLVVVSGSMQPGIMTGDLLVAVRAPTSDLRVGDVVTLRDGRTGVLVTHRVVSIEPTGDETWGVRMQGDANDSVDAGTYEVGATVLRPAVQISGGGYVLRTVTQPSVAVPLGVALVALLGLSLLPRTPARPTVDTSPASPRAVREEVSS